LGWWSSRSRSIRSLFLCIPYKILDKVHILRDRIRVYTGALEAVEDSKPGRVDVRRGETLVGVVTHVGDVNVGACDGTGDLRFVEGAAFGGGGLGFLGLVFFI
jgi:hypothetical protein